MESYWKEWCREARRKSEHKTKQILDHEYTLVNHNKKKERSQNPNALRSSLPGTQLDQNLQGPHLWLFWFFPNNVHFNKWVKYDYLWDCCCKCVEKCTEARYVVTQHPFHLRADPKHLLSILGKGFSYLCQLGAEAVGNVSESECPSKPLYMHGETEAGSKTTFPKLNYKLSQPFLRLIKLQLNHAGSLCICSPSPVAPLE